jgi:pimeloyl-ACP methyl ester carboxylesterase
VVVGVSVGPAGLLAARNAAPKSGLLEVFRDRVLPAVEAQTGPPRARLVFGESMGGVNALAAGLSLPGVFSRVVALCPPIYETSPFAAWGETWDTLKRTGADPKLVLALRALAPDYFADEAAWAAFSPLAAVQGPPPAGAPSLYVSVGLYDAYGSYAGAERLAQDAKRNGWRTAWRPLYGGHCAIDVESVAAALATED